jgi:hypothetical protein
MPEDESNLSRSALALINVFREKEKEKEDDRIVVNQLISKVASFYEKFRTAMDYGSEETIPRRAIERMLKRMLFLERDSKAIAQDLLHEMIWAGYLPNASVPESIINDVSDSIAIYLRLKEEISKKKVLSKDKLNDFILQSLSCEVLQTLIPNTPKNAVANFMYKNLKDSIVIEDDSEQTRDIQLYLAIRKSFAKDDIAFLNYRLFREIFGKLTVENFDEVSKNFESGYKEIKKQLNYPKKERILKHVKKKTPPFLILYDILSEEKDNIVELVKDEAAFKARVFKACNAKYALIRKKVQTAIARSFVFILFTKAIMALAVEGTFESIFLGGIQWTSIIINTALPPLIMVVVGLGINTPSKENSELIYDDINKLLKDENPNILPNISLNLNQSSKKTLSVSINYGYIWTDMVSSGTFEF